jgi:hypothetical protein
MTRQEQNQAIINSISADLKDLPNIQQVISAAFDAWFHELVSQGTALLQPQPAAAPDAAGGAPAPAPGGE